MGCYLCPECYQKCYAFCYNSCIQHILINGQVEIMQIVRKVYIKEIAGGFGIGGIGNINGDFLNQLPIPFHTNKLIAQMKINIVIIIQYCNSNYETEEFSRNQETDTTTTIPLNKYIQLN
ncbi:hypothetical protein Glove_139g283 [Diversispora epigaea]|uniref:Uncharacterized protein n=1 Tax=Diversispora epigaea TaxID=1348612 RepID=A0A397J4T9_9GLOM|nr:hypothetical protein Glove_139g283 [Diversispora epigaea]